MQYVWKYNMAQILVLLKPYIWETLQFETSIIEYLLHAVYQKNKTPKTTASVSGLKQITSFNSRITYIPESGELYFVSQSIMNIIKNYFNHTEAPEKSTDGRNIGPQSFLLSA